MIYEKKRILFIGHSSGRTGAPLILLRLLKWIKENSLYEFKILLKEDGILRPEYEKLAPTEIYYKSYKKNYNSKIINAIHKLLYRQSYKQKNIKKRLANNFRDSDFGLIFANTITNGDMLDALSHLKCPMITRVAELNYWINRIGEKNLSRVISRTDHFIAVSQSVKENLVTNHGIASSKISVIPGFVVPPSNETINLDVNTIRQQLNIGKNDIIICGSGEETWRKGKDLFVQLAATLISHSKNNNNLHFVWVGRHESNEDYYRLEHDSKQLGISSQIHWVKEVSNPLAYFASSDIFAMVSREDPFPIVCMEAAWTGTPIVCFKGAGGTPELVENDAGFSVPYLDVHAMAERMAFLATNKDERIKMGLAAAQKVKSHYTADRIIPALVNVIKQFYKNI